MKLSTKVAYNTIIQFSSKIIATGLGLIAIAIITRDLGQVGFGEYTVAMTFLSFFGIIADLGLTLVTVQMISRPGINEQKMLSNLLSLRLVSALIFLGLAPITVLLFPYSANIKLAVMIAAGSFLFIALNQILVGLFQKYLRLDKVSIAEVASRLVLLIGVIISIKFKFGLSGIMLATLIASAVNFLLLFAFSRKISRIKLGFNFALWGEIISLSWPLALTITLNLIYLKADTFLLSIIPRQSELGIIAEVGIYGAAYKVIDVVITFPFMFAGIILPIITLAWAKERQTDFKNVLQKSFDAMLILALPMIVGTLLLAKEIMVLIAGQDFAASGPVLQILILSAGAIFMGIMFSHAIIAINKQKKIISAYLFVALSSLIIYLIVIPRFSYFGAAWATLYSETAIGLAGFYLVWKYTRFFPNLKVLIKATLASILMGGVILLAKNLGLSNIILHILIAAPIYFIFLYLLKGIAKQDILDLINKK